ncbi:MAG: WhiB family transcriptional regulator [Actinomycetota bacterium]|nr:WhiB family transcriptional regulator [Actinomycetota bacterium]
MTAMLDLSRTRPAQAKAPCTLDPDRWAEGDNDPALRAACRGCFRRFDCARDALETRGAEGIWSGIFIPPLRDWRGRNHALLRLRSLATIGGHVVAVTDISTKGHRR